MTSYISFRATRSIRSGCHSFCPTEPFCPTRHERRRLNQANHLQSSLLLPYTESRITKIPQKLTIRTTTDARTASGFDNKNFEKERSDRERECGKGGSGAVRRQRKQQKLLYWYLQRRKERLTQIAADGLDVAFAFAFETHFGHIWTYCITGCLY